MCSFRCVALIVTFINLILVVLGLIGQLISGFSPITMIGTLVALVLFLGIAVALKTKYNLQCHFS